MQTLHKQSRKKEREQIEWKVESLRRKVKQCQNDGISTVKIEKKMFIILPRYSMSCNINDFFFNFYNVRRTILYLGQFDTSDNLTPRTIWQHGQFDTVDNLTPKRQGEQFDTKKARRTIWHQEGREDNLTSRTIWHLGQFDTTDNLTPRTIWHHHAK